MATNLYIENEVVSVKQSKQIRSKYPLNLVGSGTNGNATANNFVTGTGAIIAVNEYVTSQAIAAAGFAAAVPIYTFPNDSTTWQVVAASVRFTTAGGASAAAQVELSASATAPGSGTNQLTAGMALTGTANTVVNGTVIASPTTASAGYSLNLVPSGTMTGLVGMVVTVALQRLS